MLRSKLRRTLVCISSLLLAGIGTSAQAQQPWPTAKPITWIVGYVPGGSVDTLTRAFAQGMSEQLGQSIVIENKPGATGALALQQAARADKNGYTLITVPGPVLFGRPQPEIGKELKAVGILSQGPIVLVGSAAHAQPDLKALIATMKKDPDHWDFASSGIGTGQHLAGELLNTMAGTSMLHVPYKGGGQAVVDIASGQVKLGMLGLTPVLAQIKAGQLKAYAVTTPFRVDSLPDVPTMDEAGLKGYEATQYFAVAVPAGTPDDIVKQLNAVLIKAGSTTEGQRALETGGQVASTLSPTEAERFVQKSLEKFSAVAKDANITLN